MVNRWSVALMALFMAGLVLTAQGAAGQSTYKITVKTDAQSYLPGQQIKISGSISPAPGSSTGVTIRIFNPSGLLVDAAEATPSPSTGDYNYTTVAGGSSAWTTGTYTVNATWGAFPPTIFQTTTFTYSVATTTTASTTSTSTTSSSATSSTTSKTTSTTSSTTSVTTSTPTTSATSSSTTSSTTTTTTAPVPEFPFQAALAGIFLAAVAATYLLMRRRITVHPAAPAAP